MDSMAENFDREEKDFDSSDDFQFIRTIGFNNASEKVIKEQFVKRISESLKNNYDIPFHLYNGGYVGNNSFVLIGILNSEDTEGSAQNFSMIITGGNSYTLPPTMILLSGSCHKQTLLFSAKAIFPDNIGVELGYIQVSNKTQIWLRTNTYRSDINCLLFNASRFVPQYLIQDSKPEGLITIKIS